ncbi:MAG: sulfurtransferase-like selenium metabolism protein YedF, partial [Cyanobacteria bacterium]|nr:sulfurtransferase-like selenium metabolism protein YedF [Cyanobacteriota bacterium]
LLDDKSVEMIEALVESDVNVKNLARLVKSSNASMSCSNEGDHYKVVITRATKETLAPEELEALRESQRESNKQKVGTVVFLSKDSFGEGDKDFSESLLNVFLQTLFDSGHRPRAILMANSGVKLMDPTGAVLHVLEQFHEAGCEVMACGLCLDYYGLKERVPSEQVTNMFTICEYLMTADRVVTP